MGAFRLFHYVRRSNAASSVALGPERTMNEDIAVRALSEDLDPATAVQAIGRRHDCLRQIARRRFPSGEYRDPEGRVRLRVPRLNWEGSVRLAFGEVREVGTGGQVVRRLRSALTDLIGFVPPGRRPPLGRRLELLDAATAETATAVTDGSDEPAVEAQGIGSADELQEHRLAGAGADGAA